MRKIIVVLIIMIMLTGCHRAEPQMVLTNDTGSEFVFDTSDSGNTNDAIVSVGSNPQIDNGDMEHRNLSQIEAADEAEPVTFAVFVCGAVNSPGVYYLDKDKRIVDAVEAAGGFTKDADMSYVNLAAPVSDGLKLQIPTISEVVDAGNNQALEIESYDKTLETVSSPSDGASDNGLVNINTASASELKTLPGIGDGIAGRIIDYRTENGKFSCIEDIMKVSGIKDKLFSKIKDHITV